MITPTSIKSTQDYTIFKRIKGNRDIYKSHVKTLTEMFKYKPNTLSYNPVLVNDKLEVIDGQHRIEAAKKAKAPVYYIIQKDLGLKDIQALNSNTKPWGPIDYAKSYEELGKNDYRLYVDFAVVDFPGFSHDLYRHVLSQGRCNYTMFKQGNFQIWQIHKASDFFRQIEDFEPYYKKYKSNPFAYAFLKMFNHKDYHHATMVQSLQKNKQLTNSHVDMADYLRELEAIYNLNLHSANKIRFF